MPASRPESASPQKDLQATLRRAAYAVQDRIATLLDWARPTLRPGQLLIDVAADDAALAVLRAAELAVVSEESGRHPGRGELVVVLDPIDGTANAVRRFPHFATSLCAVDRSGALAAVVLDLSTGALYEAVREQGAWRDGAPLRVTGCERLDTAFIEFSGLPERPAGWAQGRAIGSMALALCDLASGICDGVIDFDRTAHAPWDYLGGMLVAKEAGAVVMDGRHRVLETVDTDARCQILAAATPALMAAVAERVGADAHTTGYPGAPVVGL